MITIVKTPFRSYGYSLRYDAPKDYILGDHMTFGWFKYKYLAQQRKNELDHISN